MPSTLPAYFINSSAFAAAADANVRVIARYAKDNVLLSGWLLGEDKLSGQIAVAEVGVGKGRIVLFGFRHSIVAKRGARFPLFGTPSRAQRPRSTEE